MTAFFSDILFFLFELTTLVHPNALGLLIARESLLRCGHPAQQHGRRSFSASSFTVRWILPSRVFCCFGSVI
ncbi:hypothetical protein IMZ48_00630 [Candidatus Bathyarchaeota archaeon]|nr:hypothetical protein [Candidatus Bathyarchaeota archaeon]